ncbi:MAG: hypothetical protein ACRDRJ_35975 [Streptosporangiaceae bacterium]
MPHKTLKGRPPGQESGPNISTLITTNSIPDRVYRVDELPELVLRRGIEVDQQSGCWLVGGPLDKDGYARVAGEGAHRLVWRELVSPIETGLVIDHVARRGCIWRNCVLIPHLEPVTVRTNTLRGRSFSAVNAAKDECDHGHPFDLLNTYWRPDGHRDCRACIRRRVREYKQRMRAEVITLASSAANLGRAA